jgi:hypothetical protein
MSREFSIQEYLGPDVKYQLLSDLNQNRKVSTILETIVLLY